MLSDQTLHHRFRDEKNRQSYLTGKDDSPDTTPHQRRNLHIISYNWYLLNIANDIKLVEGFIVIIVKDKHHWTFKVTTDVSHTTTHKKADHS